MGYTPPGSASYLSPAQTQAILQSGGAVTMGATPRAGVTIPSPYTAPTPTYTPAPAQVYRPPAPVIANAVRPPVATYTAPTTSPVRPPTPTPTITSQASLPTTIRPPETNPGPTGPGGVVPGMIYNPNSGYQVTEQRPPALSNPSPSDFGFHSVQPGGTITWAGPGANVGGGYTNPGGTGPGVNWNPHTGQPYHVSSEWAGTGGATGGGGNSGGGTISPPSLPVSAPQPPKPPPPPAPPAPPSLPSTPVIPQPPTQPTGNGGLQPLMEAANRQKPGGW